MRLWHADDIVQTNTTFSLLLQEEDAQSSSFRQQKNPWAKGNSEPAIKRSRGKQVTKWDIEDGSALKRFWS